MCLLCVATVVGSIPERDGHTQKMYNSCAVFDPSGNMVAKYRKLYLADTFVPGQLVVKESDVFTEGDTPVLLIQVYLYCIVLHA